MSTITASERAAAARRREAFMTRQVALGCLRSTWVVFAGFWVVMVIVLAVLTVVQARTNALDEPVFAFLGSSRFFLFVMGIILPLALLAPHVVGSGGTRRSIVRGHYALALASGVTFGLLAVLLTLAETRIRTMNDWPLVTISSSGLADSSEPWLMWFAESAYNVLYYLVGCTVGTAYYRWGGWRGTAALPLALIPAAVAELALQNEWYGEWYGQSIAAALGIGTPSAPVAVLGSLLAIALAGWLLHVVVRDIPIRGFTPS
ncbi:hypothetical protein Bcav_0484 [Beutenbergia cavernae DSM 12333]|uniref:Uncharacterized protein n=1 Tax=Beutenbergia cavernae (strain ATCC BAA-8 / DSM 12333 / CCUG 43141 / JCM 11478 / NBRC 16432 / NCIMB 13614 / HKI 0122) TaxID=471853 RepID=C5BX72_BEUC1|nr:hypothetical protein [Beutenbergia cavernae]ACQ78747.1 hypothetical protein Bcav_0484 [Beutenbergia cavernae DSM 12333]